MKRILIIALLLFFSVSFSFSNSQSIYFSSDEVFKLITDLYIHQGLSLPSTSSPYTRDEIDLMLSRLDVSDFDYPSQILYDRIMDILQIMEPKDVENNLSFSADIKGNIELYARTNIADFPLFSDWGIPRYRLPEPMLQANLSLGISNCINMYINPSIGYVRNITDTSLFEKTYVFSNLIIIPPVTTKDTSVNVPDKAVFTFGGNGWNFMLGRTAISWGPGQSGNFIFSDHVPYHDMIKFSGYSNSFKYSFISSFLVHPMNYFYRDEGDSIVSFHPNFTQQDKLEGLSMYMAHRIEWRMSGSLTFAITEAVLYQNEENHLDLRIFSPLLLFHNHYLKQYANSILSAELDIAAAKGMNLYFQIVMDDLAIPFIERESGGVGSNSPNALGYMVGMKLSFPQQKGRFFGNMEVAYTDPYLYLRDRGMASEENDTTYGNSFIAGFREYVSSDKGKYDLLFLGYPFGGDAIVCDLVLGYESYRGWNVSTELFYMCHGAFGPLTRWAEMEGDGMHTPTDSTGPGGEYGTSGEDAENKDSASHTIYISLNGGYDFTKHISLKGSLGVKTVINKDNLKSSGTKSDMQFTLGFGFRF